MDAILQSPERLGKFTSSEIYRLVTVDKRSGKWNEKVATIYIQEKMREEKLRRSLDNETFSRACEWGKLVERFVFENVLGTEYRFQSNETISHREIKTWSGTPDALKFGKENIVVDIKSPFTLNSFLDFFDCETIEDVREKHKDGEKYFWQLVSNAILTNVYRAELVVYCPYKSELTKIRELAEEMNGELNLYWLFNASDEELPYIPDGNKFYSNLKKIEFEIKKEDTDFLTEKIIYSTKTKGQFK
jgi:hypothetical protein